jgi:hypothetical protein
MAACQAKNGRYRSCRGPGRCCLGLQGETRVVVNIHAAFGDIGDVEVPLSIDQGAGQTRVDRAVGGLDHSYSVGGGRRCSIR